MRHRVNAHKDSRYTNTLMVSFNNRIYFREHPSSVSHSSGNHTVDSQDRFEAASRHFHPVQVGTPTHATTIGNSFRLNRMSPHAVELASEKEDVVTISSEP